MEFRLLYCRLFFRESEYDSPRGHGASRDWERAKRRAPQKRLDTVTQWQLVSASRGFRCRTFPTTPPGPWNCRNPRPEARLLLSCPVSATVAKKRATTASRNTQQHRLSQSRKATFSGRVHQQSSRHESTENPLQPSGYLAKSGAPAGATRSQNGCQGGNQPARFVRAAV
jgi:hypothetical protein